MSDPLRPAPTIAPPAPPAAPEPPRTTPAPQAVVSRVTRARVKPVGSRRELVIWYLMRITGLGLFVLALAHFSILHFIYDPSQQTAEFIANQRWNQFFWRAIDWSLLMLVLFHSFLGMRVVVQDYVRGRRARPIVLWTLYVIAGLLFVLGTVVVLTLPSPSGKPL
jgi:succinate dehydrogenase / fumarate reductase, membrane anchor subunit